MATRVAVVGASGYTGAEIIRLVIGHPHLELTHLSAGRSAGRRMADVYPHFAGILDTALEDADPDKIATDADVALLALPHGDSAKTGKELRTRGLRVVDLSADFRLRDVATYEKWYGPHGAPELLEGAVYGLPERYRDEIRSADLVACPGCYPTSAILAAGPLLDAGVIQPKGIVCDSKSGVSGAGRTPKLSTHFPEVGEGVRAYAVAGSHRHTPEIVQELSVACGAEATVLFTPHLVPMSRGIFTCIYADPVDPSHTSDYFSWVLANAYKGETFVTALDEGTLPDTSFVRGSNRAQVTACKDASTGKVLALCAIDNLVKGAAGQAIQCLNLMLDHSENAGLEHTALFP